MQKLGLSVLLFYTEVFLQKLGLSVLLFYTEVSLQKLGLSELLFFKGRNFTAKLVSSNIAQSATFRPLCPQSDASSSTSLFLIPQSRIADVVQFHMQNNFVQLSNDPLYAW